jgi:hypothetical protein
VFRECLRSFCGRTAIGGATDEPILDCGVESFLEKSWSALLQNISAYVPQEQEAEVDPRTIFENSSLYEHMKDWRSCEASLDQMFA